LFEQSPSLPAAGSAVEEVEVVGHLLAKSNQLSLMPAGSSDLPLMTVAQHERIVAALSAQQSAHVSVPRELMERIQYLLDNYVTHTNSEEDELRALLSGGET
jgi:hypothetical protein